MAQDRKCNSQGKVLKRVVDNDNNQKTAQLLLGLISPNWSYERSTPISFLPSRRTTSIFSEVVEHSTLPVVVRFEREL
jgi:hypothetical protein